MQQNNNNKNEVVTYVDRIQPINIRHAVHLFEDHFYQLLLAYNKLCYTAKDNIDNKIIQSNDFEAMIGKAFDGTTSIMPRYFLDYVEGFILETHDNLILEKVYNIISEKIDELATTFKRLIYNPIYTHNKTWLTNAPRQMFLYVIRLGHEIDENGNYKEIKDYFTADDLFDAIISDLKETKSKIDKLFSLKKLNEEQLTQRLYNTPKSSSTQKQTDKIQWKKDSTLLAYLFNELKNKGIIADKNVWQKLTTFFIDKNGREFKNTDFPKSITSYTKGKTEHEGKKVPKEHAAITDILTILNEVIEKHKK